MAKSGLSIAIIALSVLFLSPDQTAFTLYAGSGEGMGNFPDAADTVDGLLNELRLECEGLPQAEHLVGAFDKRISVRAAACRAMRLRLDGLARASGAGFRFDRMDFGRVESLSLALDALEQELELECSRLRSAINHLQRERFAAAAGVGIPLVDAAALLAGCERATGSEAEYLKRLGSRHDGIRELRAQHWITYFRGDNSPWSIFLRVVRRQVWDQKTGTNATKP